MILASICYWPFCLVVLSSCIMSYFPLPVFVSFHNSGQSSLIGSACTLLPVQLLVFKPCSPLFYSVIASLSALSCLCFLFGLFVISLFFGFSFLRLVLDALKSDL